MLLEKKADPLVQEVLTAFVQAGTSWSCEVRSAAAQKKSGSAATKNPVSRFSAEL